MSQQAREYGARIVQTGTVYMSSRSLQQVTAWIAEFESVGALQLVSRVHTETACEDWQAVEQHQ